MPEQLTEHRTIHLPTLHPNQQKVLDGARRFNTLRCGRRFGKTVLAQELLLSPTDKRYGALNGFTVGYFAPTYKMLMEVWRSMIDILYPITETKNEQEKRIEIFGGGVIDFWSLEDPNSIRGRKYNRVVIDEAEAARNLEDAWVRVIRATLADFKGDAWFLSTPRFGSTYFKKLAKVEDPQWAHYVFSTYDNPHIDQKEIDNAKEQLDEQTFKCEFLAMDVTLAINKFIYNWDPKIIVKDLQSIPHLPIILSFDFNRDPITCLVCQCDGLDDVRILDEYRLLNSDIYELCARIKSDYHDRMLLITGDASGQSRTAYKRELTFYKVIKEELKLGMGQFRLPAGNPRLKNTRVLTNSLFSRHKNYHFSDRVPYLVTDIEELETDENGGIDESKDKHKGHLMDCLLYFHWNFLQKFLDLRIYESATDVYGK